MSSSLSPEDIAKLKEIKATHGRNGMGTGKADCKRIRSMFRRGNSVKVIMDDQGVTRETVQAHLSGRCSCDTAVDPIPTEGDDRWHRLLCWECGKKFWAYDKLREHLDVAHL